MAVLQGSFHAGNGHTSEKNMRTEAAREFAIIL